MKIKYIKTGNNLCPCVIMSEYIKLYQTNLNKVNPPFIQ